MQKWGLLKVSVGLCLLPAPFYSQQEKADVLQVPISVLKMLFKTTGNGATGLQGHHGFVLSLLLPPFTCTHAQTEEIKGKE